jgi:hypothetical protein
VSERASGVLRFIDFSLDAANARLQRGSEVIPLRPKTLAVLEHLASRAGRLCFVAASALGVVLVVFAVVGGALALSDLLLLRRRAYRRPLRIAAHLGRMLGGTIAALTAFTVVNVPI